MVCRARAAPKPPPAPVYGLSDAWPCPPCVRGRVGGRVAVRLATGVSRGVSSSARMGQLAGTLRPFPDHPLHTPPPPHPRRIAHRPLHYLTHPPHPSPDRASPAAAPQDPASQPAAALLITHGGGKRPFPHTTPTRTRTPAIMATNKAVQVYMDIKIGPRFAGRMVFEVGYHTHPSLSFPLHPSIHPTTLPHRRRASSHAHPSRTHPLPRQRTNALHSINNSSSPT